MKQTEDDGNDDGLREHGISMPARRLILAAGEERHKRDRVSYKARSDSYTFARNVPL